MMYLRGHPKDFDNWAELVDDPSWSYKSVEEYFKSYEQYEGPWAPGSSLLLSVFRKTVLPLVYMQTY